MKTIFTLAFGLVFVMSASAQNSATVSSTGNANSATVDQTYVVEGSWTGVNEATIMQVGADHQASVVQSGAENTSNISQEGYSHNGVLNEWRGSYNRLTLTQTGGDAIAATGGNNGAELRVRGDQNVMDVIQDGSGNGIFVGLHTNLNNRNTFDIEQVGSNNKLEVDAPGGKVDDNTITTYQKGSSNQIGVYGGPADGISLYTDADSNVLDIYQDGSLNDTEVRLGGDGNHVYVDQLTNSNTAMVIVSGNNNSATVTQN